MSPLNQNRFFLLAIITERNSFFCLEIECLFNVELFFVISSKFWDWGINIWPMFWDRVFISSWNSGTWSLQKSWGRTPLHEFIVRYANSPGSQTSYEFTVLLSWPILASRSSSPWLNPQLTSDIRYIKGHENVVADALSRIELNSLPLIPVLDFKLLSQFFR